MKIELPLDRIAEAIERASLVNDEPRAHFGLSQAGHHCARWLWLSFRWAAIEREHAAKGNILTRGQLLRLFARGHREESHVVALLERAGCVFATPTDGEQFRVSFGGHVSGSLDGIILSGVPGAEKAPHVFECKTHSLKSFTHLIAHGVGKSKPIHAAQCQSYMRGTHKRGFDGPRNVKRALYVAVCKDDDRIYTERLRYEMGAAERGEARSISIVSSTEPPDKISSDPTWYQCKMCSAHDFCHVTKVAREVNCRTCAHSTPEPAGTWSCAKHGPGVPDKWTREAHDCHAMHPGLVPWDVERVVDGKPVYATEDGFISDSRQLVRLRKKP